MTQALCGIGYLFGPTALEIGGLMVIVAVYLVLDARSERKRRGLEKRPQTGARYVIAVGCALICLALVYFWNNGSC